MSNRVMSLSMRPKNLDDMVGQDSLISSLKQQFSSGRIPHFFLIEGAVGMGKTSLARVISLIIQTRKFVGTLNDADWQRYRQFDIREINAANHNGIDVTRALIESLKFKPIPPSTARVVILDEAHQLTFQAQNALITETEDVANHIYFLFCTSRVDKIIDALRRRAFILSPKLLTQIDIGRLLTAAKTHVASECDLAPLVDSLIDGELFSPGLVLQAAEKYFAGLDEDEAVRRIRETEVEVLPLCRSVAAGDWQKSALFMKNLTKADIQSVRASVNGYLKTVLLKSSGAKAVKVADAILLIASADDIPSFVASVCQACQKLN